jgi:hypothetical protein
MPAFRANKLLAGGGVLSDLERGAGSVEGVGATGVRMARVTGAVNRY